MKLQSPSTEINTSEIKKKSVSGVLALVSRTFVIQIISFVATFALTVFLDPSIYGIYYLVSSVVNFLAYFSDIGLAAALIQKKDDIEEDDLKTTFTIQQLLVFSLLLALILLSPIIKKQYHISQDGIVLLYAMGASFLMSSLKTIPSILLERKIEFNKLVVPQILETLAFNIVAVFCAWKGMGIYAFTYAVLARGVVGLVAVYFIFPWRPSFGISRKSLSHLLKFGLPYQTNTFLAVLKDDGMTIILTKIIGTEGLGYIGWASRWAGLPLRILMDNISKVSFPTFARLQHDKDRLIKAVEINLKYLSIAVFPILLAMAFYSLPLVRVIPKYSKWLPAVIPLYLYLYNSAWASISTTLTNLLNSIGRIKTTFKLMIFWTSITWLLMPFLAIKFAYLGVAYATAIIATSSLLTIVLARRYVHFSLLNSLKTPLLASLAMGVYLFVIVRFLNTFPSILASAIVAIVIYGTVVIKLEGTELILRIIHSIKSRNG